MRDEPDQNLGGEIGLPGSQTDTRAQIRESMPGAGRVSTNPGLHADVGWSWIKKWELELDYLVVRQAHEHKIRSAYPEREQSA
jgi:hypothetical protein